MFERVDSAGKGGTIQRITERTSPRVFKHSALSRPGRAGQVSDVKPALRGALPVGSRGRDLRPQLAQRRRRRAGAGLLHAGLEEQTRRLESRIDDPRKYWKLPPTDLTTSYRRWNDYLQARDAMFAAMSTEWAPWHIVDNDGKQRARLNIIPTG